MKVIQFKCFRGYISSDQSHYKRHSNLWMKRFPTSGMKLHLLINQFYVFFGLHFNRVLLELVLCFRPRKIGPFKRAHSTQRLKPSLTVFFKDKNTIDLTTEMNLQLQALQMGHKVIFCCLGFNTHSNNCGSINIFPYLKKGPSWLSCVHFPHIQCDVCRPRYWKPLLREAKKGQTEEDLLKFRKNFN